MNSPDASKNAHPYEGPNNEVIVTEKAFQEALLYLVSIQPTDEYSNLDSDAYEKAIAPYEQYSSLAINTLRRYAYDSLHSELETMQTIYYQYSKDSTYFKENVPHGLVASILREAWEGVGSWRN